MALRNWRFRRILALSLLWILIVLGIFLQRTIAIARQYPPQSDDVYVVVLQLRGGLWILLGPPALLVAAWIAVRRSRPHS
jgi:hypothetical protein